MNSDGEAGPRFWKKLQIGVIFRWTRLAGLALTIYPSRHIVRIVVKISIPARMAATREAHG
jgi:hypothetical protein